MTHSCRLSVAPMLDWTDNRVWPFKINNLSLTVKKKGKKGVKIIALHSSLPSDFNCIPHR